MKAFWRYVTAGVGFAMLVTIVLLATGWGSAAASALLNVVVTNTASNPVPVTPTGTVPVHEQGTANVNVTGTPSVALASSGNTVKIDGAGSGPLQTKAADNPAFQPISASCEIIDSLNGFGCDLYTVPAGKELVVTTVSVNGLFPGSSDTLAHVFIARKINGDTTPAFFIPVSFHGAASCAGCISTDVYFSGGTATQFYADPGTTMVGVGGLQSGNENIEAGFDIEGYLVNLPS
jgi:hypothetical protein